MKNYQIKLYDLSTGKEVEDRQVKDHVRSKVKGLNFAKLSKELKKQSVYYDHLVIAVRYCTSGDLFYIHQLMAFDGFCKIVTAEQIRQVSRFIKDYKAMQANGI